MTDPERGAADPRLPVRAWLSVTLVALAALPLLRLALPGLPASYFLGTLTIRTPVLLSASIVALVLGAALARSGLALPRVTPRPALLALLAVAALAACALVVFHGRPFTWDEHASLLQSQAFASGRVAGSWDPSLADRMLPAPFRGWFLDVDPLDGDVMSRYWPGLALLLVPFTAVGAGWLLGPVAGVVALVALRDLGGRLVGPSARTMAPLLAVASPAFVVTALSTLPAGVHLALSLLWAGLLIRGRRRDLLAAGLVGSLALALNNPVPHAAFAAPWLVSMVAGLASGPRRDRLLGLVALALGYLPGLAVLAWWPVLRRLVVAGGPAVAEGLSPEHLLRSLTPDLDGVLARLGDLVLLWGWAAPLLVPLAIIAWRRSSGPLRLLGWSLVSTWAAHLLFPMDQGVGWGARYLHGAWGALPLLAAAAIAAAPSTRRLATALAAASVVVTVPVAMALAGLAWTTEQRCLPEGEGDLRFVRVEGEACASVVRNDAFARGPLILVSEGDEADRALVEARWPGSRLVGETPRGTVWRRP